MIDLHCHVLPDLDDGPATMDEVVTLGRAQQAAGVTTVVATSHVSYDWPRVEPVVIGERVAAVNAAFASEGIAVRVVAGAEVALTRAVEMSDEELRALRLGGGPWLLLEPPFALTAAAAVHAAMAALQERGHRLVIAHPERAPVFHHDRATLERLVESGALCSITASALTGRFGRDVARFALGMLADGLVHDVASDAHGASLSRPAGLAEHIDRAGYGGLTGWLCDAMPRAILDGATLPPRPEVAPPRRTALDRLLRRP